MKNLIQSIVEHEGFRSKPYPDPLFGWDVPTFGHGLTYITEEESLQIMQNRITSIHNELKDRLPFYVTLPEDAKGVLIEMAYQMGVNGVLNFKKTMAHIAEREWDKAATEMLNSRWAKQTPGRAESLSDTIKRLG